MLTRPHQSLVIDSVPFLFQMNLEEKKKNMMIEVVIPLLSGYANDQSFPFTLDLPNVR